MPGYYDHGFIHTKIKNTRELVMLNKGAGTVTTAHECLAKTAGGLVIPATLATVRSEIEGICNQDIAAAEALTQVPALQVTSADTWIVDVSNVSNAAHNYQRMILASAVEVNNTGADDANGVVEQIQPYGLAADKKIVCRFI
jgi:hypothetical protein